MKKGVLSVLLLLCCSLSLAAGAIYEHKMPRRVQIARDIAVVMAKNGKANFEIVYGPGKVARFAAQEAAAVLSEAFGTTIKPRAKASGKVPAIIIGDTKLAAENGIDVSKFDRDGFAIRTIGNNILIVGRDGDRDPLRSNAGYGMMTERGSLFGTYDFLERFAGVRFYFPGENGTVVEPMKEWTLSTINIYDRPDYIQRRISAGQAVNGGLPKNTRALNHQRLRLETMVIPNCHGLALLQFIERFAKSNPEYFALQNNGLRHFDTTAARPSSRRGHVCFSSDIKKVIVEDAVAFLNQKDAKTRGLTHWSWSRFPAGMPFFNIMPNDCCYPCQCPQCKPFFDKGKKAESDYIWKFFVDIANEVKKRNVKGHLTTMAYANYREIPPFDIPDNLLVMLALRGPWNELNPPAHKKNMQILKDWAAKLKGKTWLWTYPSKLHIEPGVPNYAPRAVGKFYKEVAPYVFGAYMEAETDVYMFSALNYYVFSRVAWDNNADVDALIEEYFVKMYGKAAPEMKKISLILENKWLSCVGRSIETPEGPKTVFPSTVELWTKYYGEEFFREVNALFRKAEKNAAGSKTILKRIRFMQNELLEKCNDARKKWLDGVSAKGYWKAVMPENKWSDPIHLLTVKNRKTGKIDPIEVSTVVRMKRDADNYYFTFDCEEPHTDKMVSPRREKGFNKLWLDNTVEVHLDPAGKNNERYQFIVSSSGAIQTLKVVNTVVSPWTCDGVKAKAAVDDGKGFRIELTVPRRTMPEAVPGKFAANFNRFRNLSGIKSIPYYTWSVFAKAFGDQENFGRILFEEEKVEQIFKDGEFARKPKGRWMGAWYSAKNIAKDNKTFLTRGESVKLIDGQLMAQDIKFKRNTEYKLSFWVKLNDKASFNVRVDERNGYVQMLPRQKVQGPQEWIRQEFRFKTHNKAAKGGNGYTRFQLFGKGSCAWISNAELSEVK